MEILEIISFVLLGILQLFFIIFLIYVFIGRKGIISWLRIHDILPRKKGENYIE
ncbi:MAG: hypothetical protein UR25_C0002G0054 [Candidatus Nomurabacteria bacterium GW2011_GWE1_32_28]|uniref:Uncharacterized protein n=1 Tax=Candidatus Nomurabacteria bacterium GW2011_GWF1_31_48 TaxID=1618767 RepID=A0A0F9YGI0_9BACT|nr:MAG: hypothetical protein UR10_C0002G0054 [Candidatus Nomurabacteria bacterium GW2011_GWF2_30_133]KKP29057.1 MAG: hypothetical protein UR18_C0001G0178 [Candidatus Nomurabacteria bacterium GW2011_GWE2_31_40]KKP30533.1 MAG: hypothetical protein UR19_C0002G0054 [Candidatus Nomurabacteria bacterium GW2011_GWF1_31_48]KKP35018.1 MAG: hypothetical protein UR25_C0002G0054 [Candidatus Nomurabacteria bacterium GW2011_GWE1_32_28]